MDRRAFLIGSAAVAGGVAFGFRNALSFERNPLLDTLGPGQVALTPYVIVARDGVTVIAPRAEMGQGIHTTLAALVAEELDIALGDVTVEHGPASEIYSNTVAFSSQSAKRRAYNFTRHVIGLSENDRATQLTGGQSSVQDAFVKMRLAGATARACLIEAAARTLDVPSQTLRTSDGVVLGTHGETLPYTSLAETAAAIPLPQAPPLKPRSEWTRLGRSQPRVDMPGKCTGTARYAIDLRLPGMLHAAVRRSPRLGGRLVAHDASAAEGMRGVVRIVPMDDGVIVIATNTWYAFEALHAVALEWGPAPYPASGGDHFAALGQAMDEPPMARPRDDGDVDAALAEDAVLEGEYTVPYLAHATMEPLNAVACLAKGELDIWAGNQNPRSAVIAGAEVAGIARESVRVHTTIMGGGFGRRLEADFIRTAVHAARAMEGTPVSVIWSREEDMTHDTYRPAAVARFRAAVAAGAPRALDLHLASPSLIGSSSFRNGTPAPSSDKFVAFGAWQQPYRIEHYRVSAYRAPRLLPVGWWRSVGESQNSFFHECIIDEIAHAAGADPLEMRLALLAHAPSRAVLETVGEMSGWESARATGRALGVASVFSSGAATAQVVEISDTADGIRVENVYMAIDVGIALDPRNIEAQVHSAIVFGLSAAVSGEITVRDGCVEQSNFHDYPVLRMDRLPSIHIRIHESGEEIRGVGEAGTPATAPALGNAIFAATGTRLRALPFGKAMRFA